MGSKDDSTTAEGSALPQQDEYRRRAAQCEQYAEMHRRDGQEMSRQFHLGAAMAFTEMADKLAEASALPSQDAMCEDCRLPYADFGLDTVLPDADWLTIHPKGDGGLLCARCIVARAAKVPGMIVVFSQLVPSDHHDAFRQLKNIGLPKLSIALAEASALPQPQKPMDVAEQIAATCIDWQRRDFDFDRAVQIIHRGGEASARPPSPRKHRDRLLSAALKLAKRNGASLDNIVGDLEFLEVVDEIMEGE